MTVTPTMSPAMSPTMSPIESPIASQPPPRAAGDASPAPRLHSAVVHGVIDPAALTSAVADPGAGATALFLGIVRNSNDGRPVAGIDYDAYLAMAERELRAIASEAGHRFGACAVAIVHRVGHLAVGEVSVGIAASHERRAPAFAATRYAIEEIKRRVPIWKREHYADGTREWVDPTRTAAAGGVTESLAPAGPGPGDDASGRI
jgi:molybdopterin synthase catalytic subunit